MTRPEYPQTEIQETIARQITPRTFVMFGSTGTLMGCTDGLQFDVKGSRFANRVRVTLLGEKLGLYTHL